MARTAGSASSSGAIQLVGVEDVLRKLRNMEPKVIRKLLRKGLRTGAKVIAAEAKGKAPVLTGQTRAAIKVRAMTRLKRGRLGIKVQVGKGDYKGDQFYASFLELGFHLGSRKLGDNRKWIEPKPFMRPAFDAKKGEAAQAVADSLRANVEAEAKKL